MTMIKTIRYLGLCLLILANLLLFYLFSFSVIKDKQVSTPDSYAVLLVSLDRDEFPRTDFDALFSKMGLVSDFVEMSAGATAQTQQNEISAGIERIGSKNVILLAWKDSCIPVLSAAQTQKSIAAVILLAPKLSGLDAMEAFGTHKPDMPAAIFDVNSVYSISLYERLSGEDATLFPGLRDAGIISGTVHISPDGTRYLSQWDILGQSAMGQELLAFLPQVQIKIGEFISTYVMGLTSADDVDCRAEVAVTHGMKILALTFLSSGLLLFFASIPRSKSLEADKILPASGTEEKGIQRIQAGNSRSEYFRASVHMSFLTALGSFLFLVLLIILYYLKPGIVPDLLAAWPILYYAVCAVFMIRFFPKSIIVPHIPAKRLIFSGFVALLVSAGLFLLREMHTISFQLNFAGLRGVLLLSFFVFLFAFVWIRLSTDTFDHADAAQGTTGGFFGGWHRQKSLPVPYAGILIFSLITGAESLFAKSIILIAALLISLWVRNIFRRTSGADWAAAIVFSVCYVILAFG